VIHELLLEDDPPPVTLDDVLDDVFGRAEDLVRRVTNKVKRDIQRLADQPPEVIYQRAKATASRPRPQPRSPRPPPPPPAPAEPDPRVILGFAPGTKLTREIIKSRQRELAKLFHPDRGGSTEATQRLNAAAKRLLDSL
jgi:hypothetical protein